MWNEQCLIPLTQGYYAIVDKDDYEMLSKFKWRVKPSKSGVVYAFRRQYINGGKGKTTPIRMHRFIMNADDGQMVDHINGNGLDNRKSNLRFCCNQENAANRKKAHGTSKYKGVNWHKAAKSWVAQATLNDKKIHLGYYKTEEEAALAYNKGAVIVFGEFARLNVIPCPLRLNGGE